MLCNRVKFWRIFYDSSSPFLATLADSKRYPLSFDIRSAL